MRSKAREAEWGKGQEGRLPQDQLRYQLPRAARLDHSAFAMPGRQAEPARLLHELDDRAMIRAGGSETRPGSDDLKAAKLREVGQNPPSKMAQHSRGHPLVVPNVFDHAADQDIAPPGLPCGRLAAADHATDDPRCGLR